MNLIPRAPGPELLHSIARVIQDFRPPPHDPIRPVWAKKTEGAPGGHWLLPTNARVLVYNIPDKPQPPCVIISQTGDPTAMTEEPCVHWEVPIAVDIYYPQQLRDEEVDLRLHALRALLAESLPTGDAATVTPWARLSDSKVHVFNNGVREIKTAPCKTDNNYSVLSYAATYRCGTKPPSPPPA